MFDHVTYHVKPETLDGPGVKVFMSSIGFREIVAAESVPDGWKVRWFKRAWPSETVIHLVEGEIEKGTKWYRFTEHYDRLALGHFCVKVGHARYTMLRRSRHCVRDSGSGRIWLEFANLRVEVRP